MSGNRCNFAYNKSDKSSVCVAEIEIGMAVLRYFSFKRNCIKTVVLAERWLPLRCRYLHM